MVLSARKRTDRNCPTVRWESCGRGRNQAMTGRVIQGYFSGSGPKMLMPLVLPKPKAHVTGQPTLAGRTPVAQPYGGSGGFQVDPVQLGLANGGGRPLPDALRGKIE